MNTWTLAATLERAATRQAHRNRFAGRAIFPRGAVAQLANDIWITAVGFLERRKSDVPVGNRQQASNLDSCQRTGVFSQGMNPARPDLPAVAIDTSPWTAPWTEGATARPGLMATFSAAAASAEGVSATLPEGRLEASQSGSPDLLSVMAFALLLGGALYI